MLGSDSLFWRWRLCFGLLSMPAALVHPASALTLFYVDRATPAPRALGAPRNPGSPSRMGSRRRPGADHTALNHRCGDGLLRRSARGFGADKPRAPDHASTAPISARIGSPSMG